MSIPVTLSQLSISLNREELFVLLKLLKANSIAGIDLGDLQAEPDEQRPENVTRALTAAVTALVARGYVTPLQADNDEPLQLASRQEIQQQPWKRVSVPPEVLSLVATSAFPARSLLLIWRGTGGPGMLYVHEREGLIVTSTSPLPGIYTFTAFEDWEAAWHAAETALGIEKQRAPAAPPPATLQAQALAGVRDELLQQNIDEALSWLVRAGLPYATARLFLATLTQGRLVASLTLTTQDKPVVRERMQQSITLVISESTCFMLNPQGEMGRIHQVSQVSAQEIRERIAAAWSLAAHLDNSHL